METKNPSMSGEQRKSILGECQNCLKYLGMGTLYGDYEVGFYCKKCITVLHKKREEDKINKDLLNKKLS